MRTLFLYFISFFSLLVPSAALAAESITSFHSDITVHQSSVVEIVETIVYNFDNARKHGLVREIPVYFYTPSGTLITPIEVASVTDEHNQPYHYTTDEFGDMFQIKIGDPNLTVTGEHTYRIHYTATGVINYFADHDELYWNVTGNQWEVPIAKASAQVRFDSAMPPNTVSSTCYRGYSGDTTHCTSHDDIVSSSMYIAGITYRADQLNPNQGMTAVFGLPAGTVAKVEKLIEPYTEEELGFFERIQKYTNQPWVFIIPLLVFFYSLIRWIRYGRDPKGSTVIVAQFDAPDKLSPLQVGALIDDKVQSRELSAEIIHLAVLGFLKITRLPKTSFFGSDDYELEKLKEAHGLPDWQTSLLNALFGNKKKVTFSDLRNKFVDNYMSIVAEVTESLHHKGYFAEDPTSLRMDYYIKGSGLGLVLGLPGALLGWMVVVAGMAAGFIYMLMGFAMPKKTKKGVLAREHCLGFKLYLSVAEKDRINFHNAPKKDPATFEKFLPYAMIFRVEDVWAQQFKDIYQTEPRWYHDPSQRAFSVLALSSSLHSFSTTASTAMSVSHSTSASSGSSGFSGGSSGGGFGGGGGRSW